MGEERDKIFTHYKLYEYLTIQLIRCKNCLKMKRDWLWDRDLNIEEIFADEKHPRFLETAALLLARKNSAQEVFLEYIKPLVFFRNWTRLKNIMRKDQWNNPRIKYWQAIYEKLAEKYKERGIKIRTPKKPRDKISAEIGQKIKEARLKKKVTQQQLAKRIGITQQMLSRVEIGMENLSLETIKKIANKLGGKIKIGFDF